MFNKPTPGSLKAVSTNLTAYRDCVSLLWSCKSSVAETVAGTVLVIILLLL